MTNTTKTTGCNVCGIKVTRGNSARVQRKVILDAVLCVNCYDIAGEENAHADGYHDDAPSAQCPECNPVAPATGTCQCNCGGSPKGKRSRFLPGHDMRNGGFAARHAAQ